MNSLCFWGDNNTQKCSPVSLSHTLTFLHKCHFSVTKAQSKNSGEKNELDVIVHKHSLSPSLRQCATVISHMRCPMVKNTSRSSYLHIYRAYKTILNANTVSKDVSVWNQSDVHIQLLLFYSKSKRKFCMWQEGTENGYCLTISAAVLLGKRKKCRSLKAASSGKCTRTNVRNELSLYVQISISKIVSSKEVQKMLAGSH